MARLRYDNAVGTLGASLTAGGTTITFDSAPSFATLVAGDYIPMVLDPPGAASSSGKYEVAYLTAYTAGATTGTILRGQEGTTAVSHSSGAVWMVTATARDHAQNTGSRVLFRDHCLDANLPPGVTTVGTIGYNSTRKTRTLAGGSTYTLPTIALNGAVTWVWEVEWTTDSTSGDSQFNFTRADNGHNCFLKSQASDSNMFLWPMSGGSAMFSAGSTINLHGARSRFILSMSDLLDQAVSSPSTTNSIVYSTFGWRDISTTSVYSGKYSLGEVVPQGTGITANLVLSGTRTAELTQVAIYQGSWLP